MDEYKIIGILLAGLVGLVTILISFILNGFSKRIGILETDVKGMKENYLSRFNAVLQNQSDVKTELIKEHAKVKEELIAQQVQIKIELIEQNRDIKESLLSAISDVKIDIAKQNNK